MNASALAKLLVSLLKNVNIFQLMTTSKGFLKNFQLTDSIIAGGSVSILVLGVGAALVALGVTIPPIGALGMTAAIPLTMHMFNTAAPIIGQIVTMFVPDSIKQHLDGLAKKMQAGVEDLRKYMPQLEATYRIAKNNSYQDPIVAQTSDNVNFNKSES